MKKRLEKISWTGHTVQLPYNNADQIHKLLTWFHLSGKEKERHQVLVLTNLEEHCNKFLPEGRRHLKGRRKDVPLTTVQVPSMRWAASPNQTGHQHTYRLFTSEPIHLPAEPIHLPAEHIHDSVTHQELILQYTPDDAFRAGLRKLGPKNKIPEVFITKKAKKKMNHGSPLFPTTSMTVYTSGADTPSHSQTAGARRPHRKIWTLQNNIISFQAILLADNCVIFSLSFFIEQMASVYSTCDAIVYFSYWAILPC